MRLETKCGWIETGTHDRVIDWDFTSYPHRNPWRHRTPQAFRTNACTLMFAWCGTKAHLVQAGVCNLGGQ